MWCPRAMPTKYTLCLIVILLSAFAGFFICNEVVADATSRAATAPMFYFNIGIAVCVSLSAMMCLCFKPFRRSPVLSIALSCVVCNVVWAVLYWNMLMLLWL